MNHWSDASSHCKWWRRQRLNMKGFPTLKGSRPWPCIGSYCIPLCITHRPLPTRQISLKSKKLFVDGQTLKRLRPTLLRRLRIVDLIMARTKIADVWCNGGKQLAKLLILICTHSANTTDKTSSARKELKKGNKETRPSGPYLFCPADTLQHKDISVDVLHLQPAGNSQRRVSPHPVHQSSQLQQKWRCQETDVTTTPDYCISTTLILLPY